MVVGVPVSVVLQMLDIADVGVLGLAVLGNSMNF